MQGQRRLHGGLGFARRRGGFGCPRRIPVYGQYHQSVRRVSLWDSWLGFRGGGGGKFLGFRVSSWARGEVCKTELADHKSRLNVMTGQAKAAIVCRLGLEADHSAACKFAGPVVITWLD